MHILEVPGLLVRILASLLEERACGVLGMGGCESTLGRRDGFASGMAVESLGESPMVQGLMPIWTERLLVEDDKQKLRFFSVPRFYLLNPFFSKLIKGEKELLSNSQNCCFFKNSANCPRKAFYHKVAPA